MKKIVSLLLVFCLCLTLCGCVCLNMPISDNTQSTYSDIRLPIESIVPSVPESPSSSEPEVETLTNDEALEIAEDLIWSYLYCKYFCICCDHEAITEDLSQYLTESQKDMYFNTQYKITCCSSKGEIRAHISEFIDESLIDYDYIDKYYAENLFCDNNNNWYLIVVPMGLGTYDNITVTEYSNDKIIAQGYYSSEGCISETPTIFTIEKRDDKFILTNVK